MQENRTESNGKVSLNLIFGLASTIAMAFAGYAMRRVETLETNLRAHERYSSHIGQEQRSKDVERRLVNLERKVLGIEP
jgi:hypothetical protein